MKHKKRGLRAGFEDALVQLFRLPLSKLLRLPLRQLSLHREIGAGQIDGAFQVERFRHLAFFWGVLLMLTERNVAHRSEHRMLQ